MAVLVMGLAGSSGWGGEPTAVLLTADGTREMARLGGVDAEGQLVFLVDDQTRKLAVPDLVRFGNPREEIRDPLILTANGSRWVASQTFAVPIVMEDERVSFEAGLLGPLQLPLAQLRGILFFQPQNRRQRDALIDKVAAGQPDTDLVILANGDQLSGLALAVQDQRLEWQGPAGRTTVPLDQVVALTLNPGLTQPAPNPARRLLVGTRDGSRVVASSLAAGDPGVVIHTVDGPPREVAAADVCYLQPLSGSVTYLSDLPLSKYRPQPYLSQSWPYRQDRNVLGGRLRCGGQLYEKGLGVHSTAGLTYRLDRPYRRLEAELGIDDTTGAAGSVVVRIYTDEGSGQWQPKFTSPVIRGGQAPVPLSVEIDGAQRLSLIIDLADRGDQQDHLNLLDARLVP
ncbi:MAG: hypothetical protein GTO03_01890 [Planctomycetales bacterium]|nr:hypothetical protein [Planctomycetales bacterium]